MKYLVLEFDSGALLVAQLKEDYQVLPYKNVCYIHSLSTRANLKRALKVLTKDKRRECLRFDSSCSEGLKEWLS